MSAVILLDEDGRMRGTADKAAVHGASTPLHLAFSCYLFNGSGEFLLTRRAEAKRVFPGVWTNSCCGHPSPGEPMRDALVRRVREELGMTVARTVLILPRFRYRAQMNGITENELCPVYAGFSDDVPEPDPGEVGEAKWTDWEAFAASVRAGEFDVSPWCALQVAELAALGPEPERWPEASPEDLPPAARTGVV